MTSPLPKFRYHPDPIKTGNVEPSTISCACCGEARGYIYVGPVYGPDDLHEQLCPWCIFDGSASEKLDASFADSHPLVKAGMPQEVVDEVNLRTPGYSCWQSEEWLTHCGDACEFHGDASSKDVAEATAPTRQNWIDYYQMDERRWIELTKGYVPGCASAFYKFVCRHCALVLFSWDLS